MKDLHAGGAVLCAVPAETENRPGLWEPQAIRAETCKRLASYIQQHTKDMAVIAAGLFDNLEERAVCQALAGASETCA